MRAALRDGASLGTLAALARHPQEQSGISSVRDAVEAVEVERRKEGCSRES